MITPLFEVFQDEDFVKVVIKAPYIKASAVEFYVLDETFKIYAKPYFLRLVFPHALVEDGREKAEYDISTGNLTVTLPKLTPGQGFPNLDMITLLLSKGNKTSEINLRAPSSDLINPITTINEAPPISSEQGETEKKDKTIEKEEVSELEREEEEEEEEEIDWEVQQEPATESLSLRAGNRYGFNRSVDSSFQKLQETYRELIELPDPDQLPIKDRRTTRIAVEEEKFDEEHYAADFMEVENINEVLHYKTEWETILETQQQQSQPQPPSQSQPSSNIPPTPTPTPMAEENTAVLTPGDLASMFHSQLQIQTADIPTPALTSISASDLSTSAPPIPSASSSSSSSIPPPLQFTDDEKLILCQLPNKDFIIDNEREVLLGLLDIILAFAYNRRTTMGEDTVESSWTITKLSATLCWFDVFESPRDVAISFARRALCYPLYRNWKLVLKVLRDAKIILSLGKRFVLKCLLAVRKQFEKGDYYYLLNRIYVDDFCVWIQSLSSRKLQSLAQEFTKVQKLRKEEVDFSLEEIEQWAREGGLQTP